MPLSPTQAAKVLPLLKRERHRRAARSDLAAFATYHDPTYNVDRFHAHLAAALTRVVDGEIDRLIIQAPPQHGKSRLASVELPSFWLGRHPGAPIISTSYGAELAIRHSREAQEVVSSEVFREVFPRFPGINPRHSAANDWGLVGAKGGIKAAGVGGPIGGRGAMLALVDDPFKNWKEAQSSTIREAIRFWFESTFLPRVWEGGRVVIITTRWNPEDLVGYLLEKEPGRWVVLNYPALNEDHLGALPEGKRPPGWLPDSLGRAPGEPLAPSRFSKAYLESLTVGEVIWAALYQQRPTTLSGGVMRVERFNILEAVPEDVVRWVRFWDLAATPEGAAPDPDFTAGVLVGQRASGRWVVADVVHGRYSPAGVRDAVLQTAKVDGRGVAVRMEQEPGSAGIHLVADYVRLLAGWDARGVRATGAQLARVMPFAAQVDAGNVDLVRRPWLRGFLDECRVYSGNGATHDDQVVAAAGAFLELAAAPAAMAKPKRDQPDPELEVRTWDE